MKRPPGPQPLELQRNARRDATEPEKRLWSVVRNRQIASAKFRRQAWFGPFLLDFHCAAARLPIEVDGDSHAQQQEYDAYRTAHLESEGLRVIRFSNGDVMRNLDGVVAAIAQARTLPLGCAEWAPPFLLQGEGL